MAKHVCKTHKVPMEQRDMRGRPQEQKWQGVWWDCPRCTSSVLEVSPELQKFLEGQKASASQGVLNGL